MRKISSVSLLVLFFIVSCNGPEEKKVIIDQGDLEMVSIVYQNALFGLRTAEEAVTRGTSVDTKSLAAELRENKVRIKNEFEKLAGRKRFELPLDIDDHQLQKWRELVTKKGWQFDKTFVDMVVKIDSASQANLARISTNAKDADFRNAAQLLSEQSTYNKELVNNIRMKFKIENGNYDTLRNSLTIK